MCSIKYGTYDLEVTTKAQKPRQSEAEQLTFAICHYGHKKHIGQPCPSRTIHGNLAGTLTHLKLWINLYDSYFDFCCELALETYYGFSQYKTECTHFTHFALEGTCISLRIDAWKLIESTFKQLKPILSRIY